MPLDVPSIDELRGKATPQPQTQNVDPILPGTVDTSNGIGPAIPLKVDEGEHVLAPAMGENGKLLTRQEASNRFTETGENYGTFPSQEAAQAFQGANTSDDARDRMRAAILLSRGIQPDQIAQDKAWAKQLGIPWGAVRYNREESQDEVDARLIEQYQGLVEYASRSDAHAAIVRGDTEGLSKVANAVQVMSYDLANNPEIIRAKTAKELDAAGRGGSIRESHPYSIEGQQQAWRFGELQKQYADLGNRWAAGEDVSGQEEAIRKEMASIRENSEGTGSIMDSIPGLNLAIQQAPINLGIQIQAATVGMGSVLAAAGTAAATTVATGGTAAPLALGELGAAFTAGYLSETALKTYEVERGAEIQTMREMKDAEGNPLPRDVIIAASSLYAFVSAGTEVAGEAVFLRALKPLGIGMGATKSTVKGALERAVMDKSRWSALIDTAARLGITTISEGATEGVQETEAIAAETAAKAIANQGGVKFDTSVLTEENSRRIKEAVEGGMAGGFWQSGGPVIVSGVIQQVNLQKAQQFSEAQKSIHELIEQTETLKRDPEAMAEILEALSPTMQEEVAIPMDAALELHQEGTDILTPLGISQEAAQEAAENGQSVYVRLGNLHVAMDAAQFKAVAEIMIRGDQGESAADAKDADQRIEQTLRQIANDAEVEQEVLDGFAALQPEQKTELQQAHQEMLSQVKDTVAAIPGLANQAEIQAGDIETYANSLLELWRRRAIIAARHTGENPADIYRRTVIEGVDQAQQNMNSDQLYHMFPSKTQDVRGFLKEVRKQREEKSGEKSYVMLGNAKDRSVLLSTDVVAHIWNHHPDFDSWEEITDVIDSGEQNIVGVARFTNKEATLFHVQDGEKIKAVIASPVKANQNKKLPERYVVLTAFEDNAIKFNDWLSRYKNKNTALSPTDSSSADGTSRMPRSANEAEQSLSEKSSVDKPKLTELDEEIKRIVKPQSLKQEDVDGQGSSNAAKDFGTLYSEGDLTPNVRGSITPRDGNYFINLFRTANLSTLPHEMGHAYFLELERTVQQNLADDQLRQDYETLCKWVGADSVQSLNREQHEQLARGWEAYLAEGKAPTPELQGVFSRFRQWFLRIYQAIKNIGVELNDEVRAVFDRMIATQEEIEAAAVEYNLLNLTTEELDAMGVTRAQQEYARQTLETAKRLAAERLHQKRDAERKSRRTDYAKKASEELRGNPRYLAAANMRKAPIDLEIMRSLIGDEAVNNLMRRHPGSLKKDSGVDPTVFAAEHGYESAEALAADMISLARKGDAIKARVDELDAQFDAQFDATTELFNSEGLAEHASLVARHLAKMASSDYIQQQAIAKVAMAEMAKKRMGEAIKVGHYRGAMRRALGKVRKAIHAGDYTAAYAANTQARINLEMAKISQELSDNVDKMGRKVKRFINSKSVSDTPKFFLSSLASQHGVMDVPARFTGMSMDDVHSWITKLEDDGYTLALDPNVMTSTTPWQEMTTEEFGELLNAFNQIITTERNQRKLLTAKGKAELESVVNDIAASVMDHGKPLPQKTVEKESAISKLLGNIHASHMKIEELCIQMDGGKMGGPCWTYIYKPIADADNNQALRLRDIRNHIKEKLFSMYTPAELSKMGVKKTLVPEIGESITFENRLAVALNMGNEQNIDRIRDGHQWDDEQIAAVLKPLTERDWKFIQGVWDYFETFRDESFKLQEDITGQRPKAVEPLPFTVNTSDGKTMQLRGGYYPIAYSRDHSEVQFQRDQKQMDQELFGGRNYGAAMTKHGHLKERARGLKTPLRLELAVIPEHLFNVAHDLAFRRAVLDVAKVIRHKTVQDAIVGFAGREIYRQLKPWLQDVANERQEPMSGLQKAARWARASSSIMQMGLKITTMVMQPIGITQTMDVLGMRWTAAGIRKVFGNMWRLPELYRETCARSQMMATRIESYDREIRDITKSLQTGTIRGWVDALRKKAFMPMGYFQMAVDLPTWWGAYEKGIKDFHGDEEQAVQYADSIVRQAQGSGSTKDLAQIQRGSDLQRLFTMFYSYFNVLYNLGARHIRELKADHSPAGIFRTANSALLLWFIPSVLSEIVAGRGPGDDGDDDWLLWASRIWFMYPFQAVVGLRDVINGIASGYDYSISPAASAPESIVKATKSIWDAIEKDEPEKMVKKIAEAVGYGMSLPLKQPIITVGNMWDYVTDPASEFYVRDLFFTKPKDRR